MGKPLPVHVPSNKDLNRESPATTNSEEVFDIRGIDLMHDPRMSSQDAQKALRDLISDVYSHEDQEVDMADAKVEGFQDTVLLLPHQVLGRKWMAERETGKKSGGLLADEMGFVISTDVYVIPLISSLQSWKDNPNVDSYRGQSSQ